MARETRKLQVIAAPKIHCRVHFCLHNRVFAKIQHVGTRPAASTRAKVVHFCSHKEFHFCSHVNIHVEKSCFLRRVMG